MWFCLLCHNFSPPGGCATRGTGDLVILIVNENEKWQHTEPLRLNEEQGEEGSGGKCITEEWGFFHKGISNFSLPNLHFFYPDYASLALHAQDVKVKLGGSLWPEVSTQLEPTWIGKWANLILSRSESRWI